MEFHLVVVLCLLVWTSATEVKQCNNGKNIDNINSRVTIGSCNKPPCRLRKNSFVNVALKFKPDHDVTKLVNTVNANVFGIPFPFVGVDGESACDKIYKENDTVKAGCDLKAGQEYVYKTDIEVLQIYPRLKTNVHWALTEPNGNDVFCFEVPARITN